MDLIPVTDPSLLKRLEEPEEIYTPDDGLEEVTDPNILKMLETDGPLPIPSPQRPARLSPSVQTHVAEQERKLKKLGLPVTGSEDPAFLDAHARKPKPVDMGDLGNEFLRSVGQQNFDLYAEALMIQHDLTGDPQAKEFADLLKRAAKSMEGGVAPRKAKQNLTDVRSIQEAIDWAQASMGQGVGSTMGPLVGGGMGYFGGKKVGGKVGGKLGAGVGALFGSAPLSLGEMRKALIEEGVEDPKLRAEWAIKGGLAMAALDSALPASLASKIMSGGTRKAIQRGIVKRIMQGGARSAAVEGATEGTQASIEYLVKKHASGNPVSPEEWAHAAFNEGAAGAVGGAGMGATTGAIPDQPIPDQTDPALSVAQPPPQPTTELKADRLTLEQQVSILQQQGYEDEQIVEMDDAEREAAAVEGQQAGIEPIEGLPSGDSETAPVEAEAPTPVTPPPPEETPQALIPESAPIEPEERGTRNKPQKVEAAQDLDEVRRRVDTEPTEKEQQAGNYQKGHVKLHGFDISIENPKGSIRRGKNADGTEYESAMPADYGYLKRTTGRDDDHVDAYIGNNPESQRVFVIDQVNPGGKKIDEHKLIFGTLEEADAVHLYHQSFSDGEGINRIGSITETTPDQLREWLAKGSTTRRFAKQKRFHAKTERVNEGELAIERGVVAGSSRDVNGADETAAADNITKTPAPEVAPTQTPVEPQGNEHRQTVVLPDQEASAAEKQGSVEPDRITTGTVLLAKSGRELSPVPKVDLTSDRAVRATRRRLDAWLLREAKREAYTDKRLKKMDASSLSPEDIEHIKTILFGESDSHATRETRTVPSPGVQELDEHDQSLPEPPQQELSEVRGEGNNGVRGVAGLSDIPKGYGPETTRDHAGPDQQRLGVQSSELPVGDASTAVPQSTEHRETDDISGQNTNPHRVVAGTEPQQGDDTTTPKGSPANREDIRPAETKNRPLSADTPRPDDEHRSVGREGGAQTLNATHAHKKRHAPSDGARSAPDAVDQTADRLRKPDVLTRQEPPKTGNLYQFVITDKQREHLKSRVNVIAKRIMGRTLPTIEFHDTLPGGFEGGFLPSEWLIALALQSSTDPRLVIRHEAVHVLRKMDLFTDGEWRVLSRLADRKWLDQFQIRGRYKHYANRPNFDALVVEEAISEAFLYYSANGPQKNAADRIFEKLKRLIEAIRNLLKGEGFTSVNDIFDKIESGKVATRAEKKAPVAQPIGQEVLTAAQPPDGNWPTGSITDPTIGPDPKDFQSNINLDKIAAPEDVKAVITTVGERAQEFITERRGVVSNEQTKELAKELGMNAAELAKRTTGQAFNAHEIYAARVLMVQSASTVRNLAAKASQTKTLHDLAQFQKAFTRHVAIQEQIAGMTAEAGRALQQFKMMAGANYLPIAKAMADEAKAKDKKAPFGAKTKTGTDAIVHLADMINALDDPSQLNRFTRDAFKVTIWDKIREIWINALLSGPRTHATNILSNFITALWQVPETSVAAMIGSLHGGDKVRAREATARLIGVIEGTKEGLGKATTAFITGEPTDAMSKVEQHRRKAVGGMVGEIVRIPSKALLAEDEFFKTLNRRAEINARAVRLALNEGLKGQALSQRIAELKANPPPSLKRAADEWALYQTFQNHMGPIGTMVMRLRDSVPGLYLLMPFIRTPANLIKYAAERTPFGLMMGSVRDNLSGKHGNIARDMQLARMGLGSSIALVIGSWAMAGILTGSGPDDPDERRLWLEDHQPYAIKFGDTWISYQRMDPFGLILGITADLIGLGEAVMKADGEKVGSMIVGALSQNLLNKTWLSGLSDFIEAVQDPQRYGEGYVRRMAGTLIPNLSAQIAQTIDPVLRDAQTTLDNIKTRIPGMGKELPPRRNIFGEPIRREGSLGPDLLSPLYLKTDTEDPVVNAMLEIDYAPSMPSRRINGHELTPQEYSEYAEIAGKEARVRIEPQVRGKGWRSMPPDLKIKRIKKAFDESRELARKRMKRRYPHLRKGAT